MFGPRTASVSRAAAARRPGRRVALLLGGDSAEREISRASGAQAAEALRAAGHDAACFDPRDVPLDAIPWGEFDVCFLALHGGAGEDGRVQAQLDALGVPYTGSDAQASRLAMSKSASKERFIQRGVPTLPYALVCADELRSGLESRLAHLPWPRIVKPDEQGSSLGLGFAATPDELSKAILAAACYGGFVLIEPWIDGREFTVAILGRRPLPLVEIATPRGLFDYEAKYEDPQTEHRFETGLPADVSRRIIEAAVAAADALATSGLVRVDLMLDRRGAVWVLEVNTLPGLTQHSLAPAAAARAGLPMAPLCNWMIEDALARHAASAQRGQGVAR